MTKSIKAETQLASVIGARALDKILDALDVYDLGAYDETWDMSDAGPTIRGLVPADKLKNIGVELDVLNTSLEGDEFEEVGDQEAKSVAQLAYKKIYRLACDHAGVQFRDYDLSYAQFNCVTAKLESLGIEITAVYSSVDDFERQGDDEYRNEECIKLDRAIRIVRNKAALKISESLLSRKVYMTDFDFWQRVETFGVRMSLTLVMIREID